MLFYIFNSTVVDWTCFVFLQFWQRPYTKNASNLDGTQNIVTAVTVPAVKLS